MAKILYGAIVTDMRNKTQGQVFSKNKYGNYLRNNAVPINPRSPRQGAQRAAFGNLASLWRTLTDDQRSAWASAVPDYPFKDVFGNSRLYAPNALFQKLNLNMAFLGNAALLLPLAPAKVSAWSISDLTATAAVPSLSLILDLSDINSDDQLIIAATPQVSPGIANFNRSLRYIETHNVATPVNLLASYVAVFGPLIAGLRIGVKVYTINDLTGQASTPQYYSVIVAA